MPSTAATLPDTLRLGVTHLTVADVDRSVAWYQAALGLRVHTQDVGVAALGDGDAAVLVLHEDAQARPAGRHSGLYHVALLYPTRAALGRAALRLAATRTGIQGASTHATHEAIYLADPDGNGLELAADFPRERWESLETEMSRGGPRPLDFEDLVRGLEPPTGPVDPGLATGHVHLHVGSIADGLRFYRDGLGLEVQAQIPTAVFASAGGYHHHLAFNVWRGEGAAPVPPHTVGLREWTVVLPDAAAVAEVRGRLEGTGVAVAERPDGFSADDPWGMTLVVVAG